MMNNTELEEIRILLRTYLSELSCHIEHEFVNTSNWGTPYFETEDEMNVYEERVRKIYLNLESHLSDSEKEERRRNRTIRKLRETYQPN